MKTALVTGSGIRIGRAIALELARAGFNLALHANRSKGPLEEVAKEVRELGGECSLHLADLSTAEGQDQLAKEVLNAHPRLDALVNNAGIFESIPFAKITREQWRRMQAVNLEAPAFLTQALLPALNNAPSASVVNICDIGGERPYPEYTHYSVSKAGLIMLTRSLAVELAPKIRVNAVSPGTAEFPDDYDEEQRAAILATIPMGRAGHVEDIAKAILFLIRDAPFVNGHTLNVDGGRIISL